MQMKMVFLTLRKFQNLTLIRNYFTTQIRKLELYFGAGMTKENRKGGSMSKIRNENPRHSILFR